MQHSQILEPNVTASQGLIVTSSLTTLSTMSSIDEKQAFSQRMNIVADLLGIPPHGQNRQTELGKMFGVSQKGARKWLMGESIPATEKSIEIAKRANVQFEWFMTGRGPMRDNYETAANTPERQVLMLMENMDVQTKYKLVKIGNTLVEPNGSEGDNQANTK